MKDLSIENIEVVYWSDSSTVLSWINREAQWNVFVLNRVQEIRDLSAKAVWRHVPGVQNPADLPSRGCTPAELVASRWWEGPAWLKLSRSEWPATEFNTNEEEINSEVKKLSVRNSVSLLNKNVESESARYCRGTNDFIKILKIAGWVNRFTKNARIKKDKKENREANSFLIVIEIKNAEILILKRVQKEMFSSVHDNKLKNLNAFIDENGLIRIKTKIFHRDDDKNFKCPIVLDSGHFIVNLIIEHEHVTQ